jgi:hypothetical protein
MPFHMLSLSTIARRFLSTRPVAKATGYMLAPATREGSDQWWYTRRDSNSQFPVSKTGAFAVLATRA